MPRRSLAALQDRAERDDHDEPGQDRHDALPHRAARRVHEVDGLGLLGLDLAGTGVGRARGREAGVGRAPGAGRDAVDRNGARVGGCIVGGRAAGQHVLLEVVGELAQQLARHVGHHAAAELRDLAGDVEVGVDVDRGAVAVGDERRDDGGRRVALAAGVAALRPAAPPCGWPRRPLRSWPRPCTAR